jgi:hypothetical protein
MGRHFLVNRYDRDESGEWELTRRGATRDPSQMLGADHTPTQVYEHIDCPRCRGTKGGPNPFVAERKCKKCKGMGFILGAPLASSR